MNYVLYHCLAYIGFIAFRQKKRFVIIFNMFEGIATPEEANITLIVVPFISNIFVSQTSSDIISEN